MPRASEPEGAEAGAGPTRGPAASVAAVHQDLRALARALRPAATPAPAVAVCGWSSEDGASDVAAGLAGALAREGAAVTLVDWTPGPDSRDALEQVLATIADVKRRGGCVVLDLPPLRDAAMFGQLQSTLDGTVLVVRRDSTRRDDVHRAANLLRDLSAPFLGVVLAQDSRPWWGRSWRRSETTPRRPL